MTQDEKLLKHKDLPTEVQWNVECDTAGDPANERCDQKPLDLMPYVCTYSDNTPVKHACADLQKTTILRTAHISKKILK